MEKKFYKKREPLKETSTNIKKKLEFAFLDISSELDSPTF